VFCNGEATCFVMEKQRVL